MRFRRLALVAAVAVVSAVAGFAVRGAVGGQDARDDYEARVVDELLRMERRKADVARSGYERFADLLPIIRGRGFPLVVIGRVTRAAPTTGYGQVAEPCDLPPDSGASCGGLSTWQAIPVDDARAAEVVIGATVEVIEVLARDGTTARSGPSTVHIEWIVSGPATPSPADPREVADALRALGTAVWVLTEPGSIAAYATNEEDPMLATVAWPPFGVARVDDDGRVEPLAGPIPASLDTVAELRRTLRGDR